MVFSLSIVTLGGEKKNLNAYKKKSPSTTVLVDEILNWDQGKTKQQASKNVHEESLLCYQILECSMQCKKYPEKYCVMDNRT